MQLCIKLRKGELVTNFNLAQAIYELCTDEHNDLDISTIIEMINAQNICDIHNANKRLEYCQVQPREE